MNTTRKQTIAGALIGGALCVMAAAVLVGCVAAATGDGSDKNKPVPELTITGTVAVGARVKAADVDVACGTSTTPRTTETDTMGVYSLIISGAEGYCCLSYRRRACAGRLYFRSGYE